VCQIIVGANSLIQSVIPRLFPPPNTPEAASLDRFYARYVGTLEANASFITTRVQRIPGLSVVVPQGAMYVMLRLLPHAFPAFPLTIGEGIADGDADDVAFAQALLAQENVVLLPGHVFGVRSFVRLVLCAPMTVLEDAMDRLEAFCIRHYAPLAHQEEKTQHPVITTTKP
jgi:tyrosine aminotransferase